MNIYKAKSLMRQMILELEAHQTSIFNTSPQLSYQVWTIEEMMHYLDIHGYRERNPILLLEEVKKKFDSYETINIVFSVASDTAEYVIDTLSIFERRLR